MGLIAPRATRQQLRLLAELTEALAVSGDESAVRKLVRARLEPVADELRTDPMGNLLVTRRGEGRRRLRVMLAAHMDEVGVMIVAIDSDGLAKFEAVGGLSSAQLIGKPVWVGRERVNGVIGGKPVHLAEASELKQPVKINSLRIDVGAISKEAAQANVKPGDRASFATTFARVGDTMRGKALDDRVGVATLIELIEHPPAGIELCAAFTVQEELGLRGAGVAARAFEPDVAIALDCTPAMDMPTWDGSENVRYNTRLGHGPAIYAADSSTIAHPGLLEHFLEVAEAADLKHQLRQPGGGGTDAGSMHLANEGIPSLSVSVPTRYLHTAVSLARLDDWRLSVRWVHEALSALRPSVLSRS